MTPEHERCRSCGAQVIWALHTSGKPSPFDAEPHDDGEWEILYRRGETPTVVHVQPGQLQIGQGTGDGYASHLHRPHWATCPQADQWRNPT